MMCCKYRLLRWCFEKFLSVSSLGEIIMVIYATFGSKGRALRVTLAALVAGALMLSFSARGWAGGYTLQLAFIGPLSGKDSDAGQAMLDGVNLFYCHLPPVDKKGAYHGSSLSRIVQTTHPSKNHS